MPVGALRLLARSCGIKLFRTDLSTAAKTSFSNTSHPLVFRTQARIWRKISGLVQAGIVPFDRSVQRLPFDRGTGLPKDPAEICAFSAENGLATMSDGRSARNAEQLYGVQSQMPHGVLRPEQPCHVPPFDAADSH